MTTLPGTFSLEAFLEVEWSRIEATRRSLTDSLLQGAAPVLAQPIRYALDAGGKRLRPILAVTAYRAVRQVPQASGSAPTTDQDLDPVYQIATAIEFIHTYSLIHDDLPCMDDDELRRGHPTTHRKFGVRAATVAGAALIPLALDAIDQGSANLGLNQGRRRLMIEALCRAAGAGGMIAGQWLDLEAEGDDPDLDGLQGVHRRKTGALLAASAQIGGMAAGADKAILDALGDYGLALGLAFQIADDILDLTGDSSRLGKVSGRDLSLGKATYPALLGLEGARERAFDEAERAVMALEGVGLATVPLRELARYAVERDH